MLPADMGDNISELKRAFKQAEPVMKLPVFLVSHQELRTNLRVRRVYDFIAKELRQVVN